MWGTRQYLGKSRCLKLQQALGPVDWQPPPVGPVAGGELDDLALYAGKREGAHARSRRCVVQRDFQAKYVVKAKICAAYGEKEAISRLLPFEYVIDVEDEVS